MALDTRETGRLATLTDSESSPSLMEVAMRAAGTRANIMVKESILHHQAPNMMGIGKWESIMVLAVLYGQTGLYTRENGEIAGKMVEESFLELMELSTTGSGKMVNIMEKENYRPLMAKCL